jgi:hypothetical protein
MAFEVVSKQIKKTKPEILAVIKHSLEKNNAIGILIKSSNGLITTAIEDIEDDLSGDVIISLKQHDLHGYPLQRTRFMLSDIESVIHFNVPFDDPQYLKVRKREKLKA